MKGARYRQMERLVWATVGAAPTERRIHLERNNVTVRVQELGEQGPAVLFVHGASAGGSCWAHLAARLQGFRCVVIDRPGTGLSDAVDAKTFDDDSLPRLADTLVIDVLDALA